MIITAKDLDYILAHKNEAEFNVKVDFATCQVRVKINKDKAFFENGCVLRLDEKLKAHFCYSLNKRTIKPVAFFSQNTNRFYKLTPTEDWPTLSISSVPMHQLISPQKDTQNKINLIKPYGLTLDTCMGLGYTAILAAKTASNVVTFEKDENVHFLAKINPLSKELFCLSNIEIRRQDIAQEIKKFDSAYFDCIIHDPPTFKLSVELYTLGFYQELKRVLKKGGRLFHYTPRYKACQGEDFPAKIQEKLRKAGFIIINTAIDKGGVVCRS